MAILVNSTIEILLACYYLFDLGGGGAGGIFSKIVLIIIVEEEAKVNFILSDEGKKCSKSDVFVMGWVVGDLLSGLNVYDDYFHFYS